MSTKKRCPKCRQWKVLDAFHRNTRSPSGRMSYCKMCTKRVNNSEAARAKKSASARKIRAQDPARALFDAARGRARARGIRFALRREHVIVPALCPVLGIELRVSGRRGPCDTSPSLDRIDPKKGYMPGNVRVISWRANKLKADATEAELAAVLAYLRGSR